MKIGAVGSGPELVVHSGYEKLDVLPPEGYGVLFPAAVPMAGAADGPWRFRDLIPVLRAMSSKLGQSAPLETGDAPYPSAPTLPGLLERIKNIVLTPKSEWSVIEAEATSVGQLYSGYVMPMAAFAAVMSFIRMTIVGVNVPLGGTIRTPMASGLVSSVVTFVLGLIGLYLVGLVINVLAPTFAGSRDHRQALKTAAYALTPAWIGTALTFLPLGPVLQLIAGIYGIYVLYLGLPLMMRSRREKAGSYAAVVVVCTLLVGVLFGALAAVLGSAAAQAH